jgi:hypothetical protein
MSQLPIDEQVEDDAEFERRLRLASRDHRLRQIQEIGLDGVTWLAVVPSWTTRLADATRFPYRQGSIDEFVAAAEAARLCVKRGARRRPEGREPELRVLASLGSELPPELAGRALKLMTRADERTRVTALVDLAPALGPDQTAEALGLATAIRDPSDRGTALAALWGAGKTADFEDVRSAAVAAAAEAASARVYTRLAEIAPEFARDALRLLAEPEDDLSILGGPDQRALLLARLAPILPKRDHDAYLALVRELSDPPVRVELALALAPRMSDRGRRALLQDAVAWAAGIEDPAGRSAARLALAGALTDAGDLPAAEAEAGRIEELDTRALAYGALSGTLAARGDAERAAQFLASARSALEDTVTAWQKVGVLVSIAHSMLTAGDRHGASGVCDEALTACADAPDETAALRDTAEGFRPLTTLAEVLAALDRSAGAPARRAYAIAQRLGGARERAVPLLLVAPLLPPGEREAALEEALEALRAIADPLDRVPLLLHCLRQLPASDGVALVRETVSEISGGAGDTAFWMPEPARVEILDVLIKGAHDGPMVDLVATVGQAGAAIWHALEQRPSIPAPLVRWSQLANAVKEGGVLQAGAEFVSEYGAALAAGDVAAALDWIDTGAALAGTLGDETLASSVRYARRRMELVQRELEERRSPEPFLEREDQLAAFEALRADDGSGWALHYLGLGGVGKSTLIRHLARLGREQGFVTAKVDFDYLSPDYPVRKPAQLLLELMAELELHVPPGHRGESLIRSFRDTVVKLHEDSVDPLPADPEAQLDERQFVQALDSFCDVLRILDREVILILDTCEELARFAPEGSKPRNVAAAFGAIERIQEKFNAVRVVFAGRRLLASSGAGWEAVSGPALANDPRPYLRLQAIRGFDATEAADFLESIKKLQIEPEVRDAVLKASPQPEIAEQWSWKPSRPSDDTKRYNPFDLAMYAEWIAEVGNVTADEIESEASDPYVELRIVGRIPPERLPGLRELLPAVALLERFDAGLLRPAFYGSDDELKEVFHELGQQEWLARIESQDGGPTELVVDANLRPRLLAYYREEPRLGDTEDIQLALADGVAERLGSARLGRITPEHLEAAVDILPEQEPPAIWHQLVRKFVEDQHWEWAARATRRLLGDEGVLKRTHPAFAAVTATLAAVHLHEAVEIELGGFWREVLATAENDPDPAATEWLTARARAGLVVAGQVEHVPALLDVLSRFPGTERSPDDTLQAHRCEQLAASCCAALEALVEPPADPEGIVAWADRLEGLGVSGVVCAAAQTAAARSLAAVGRVQDAIRRLADAERWAIDVEAGADRWLDWRAPASPRDRVRLEALRLGADPLLETDGEYVARIETIDGERLLSAVLAWRLARAPVSAEWLSSLEERDQWDPRRRPVCEGHRVTRPLFCSVAHGWLALGDASRALLVLSRHKVPALQSANDPATVRAAELTTLEVLCRMRMRGEETVLVNEYAGLPGPVERDAALAVIALARGPDEQPPDLPWRFRDGLSWERREQLVASGAQRWAAGAPEPGGLDERIERADYELLAHATRDARVFRDALAQLQAPGAREPDVRRALRAFALTHDVKTAGAVALPVDALMPLAGPRRLGELALEEGELLALRHPSEARVLLGFARERFAEVGDPVGVLQASIRLALAHAHAKDEAVNGAVVDGDLRSAFAAAVAAGAIPSEPHVDALLRDPFAAAPSAWTGWQQRLGLALRFCAGQDGPPRTGAAPAPVELDLDPWGERPADVAWRSVIGIVTVTLVAIAAAGAGGAWLVQRVLRLASVDVSLLVAVGILTAAVIAVYGMVHLLRSMGHDLRSARAARAALRLSVSGAGEATGAPWPPPGSASLRLRVRRTQPLRTKSDGRLALELYHELWSSLLSGTTPRLWRLDVTADIEAAWDTPPLGPYEAAATTFPAGIAGEIADVLEAARSVPVPLTLELPPALMGLPWEAFIARAARPAGKLRPFRHEPRREATGSRAAGRRPVAVLSSRGWRRLATDGWSGWRGPVFLEDDPASLENLELRVIHAIGRPAAGTSEWILLLGGDDATRSSVRGSEALLRPQDLADRRASLVILQAEPFETGERFSTEREDAARLKLLAAAVFAAGAEAVLTIPALGPALAEDLVRRIAKPLRPRGRFNPMGVIVMLARMTERRLGMRSDPELGRLLAVVDELRERILQEQEGAEAAELAGDVCLFARSDLAEYAAAAAPPS